MSVTPPSSIWGDVSEDRDGGNTIMVESVDNIGLVVGVSKAELFDAGDPNLPDSEAGHLIVASARAPLGAGESQLEQSGAQK